MKKRTLGSDGPQVSSIGLGCMGMSEFYGPTDDEASKKVLRQALENGVTMLDTADTYGHGHNEKLIAEALKDWDQDIFIATKFGIVRKPGDYRRDICGTPAYVRQAAEKSLKRLNIEAIDLYYVHRIDQKVPIEETVGAMADLVREGKVRYIGLSEPAAKTVVRAHAVHPITCVQSEYSLFTRDVEEALLPTLREKGIGFVPYSPLGRGLLTGKLTRGTLADEKDFRNLLPRTAGENYDSNMMLVHRLRSIADQKGITLSQLALAWVLSKGDDIVPIPGTRTGKYLRDNIAAVEIHLDDEDIERIEAICHPDAIQGARYTEEGMKGVNA